MTENNTIPLTGAKDQPQFQELRLAMVERQLRDRGIRDNRVLAAMAKVPRHEFVARDWHQVAYADTPVPIGHGQTISQPYTVAIMCELAELAERDAVLEIGTGSGFGTAVLAELVGRVHTLERIPELARAAKATLARLAYTKATVHLANGSLGLPTAAPFDAIIVTAAGESLPPPYQQQLVDGGRIVMPIGPCYYGQRMFRFTRRGDDLDVEDFGEYNFVRLIGEHGWPERYSNRGT